MEQILNTGPSKENNVFTQSSTCQWLENVFPMKMRYHKHCYRDYLRLPRNSTNSASRLTNQISKEILNVVFDKLTDEIKDRFSTHSFKVHFIAHRLAALANIEIVLIENRVVKSPLDKFGENILLLFLSARYIKTFISVYWKYNIGESIRTVRFINSKNYISVKGLCQELL